MGLGVACVRACGGVGGAAAAVSSASRSRRGPTWRARARVGAARGPGAPRGRGVPQSGGGAGPHLSLRGPPPPCWRLTRAPPPSPCFSPATDINLNSPNKGLLADSMTDVPVESAAAARAPACEGLTPAEEEELRTELAKVRRGARLGPSRASGARGRDPFLRTDQTSVNRACVRAPSGRVYVCARTHIKTHCETVVFSLRALMCVKRR